MCMEWCAGAQSGRRSAEKKGYVYRGADIREHVYSAVEGGWVRNVAMDLMKGTFVGVWEQVKRSVEEGFVGRRVRVVMLVGRLQAPSPEGRSP